MKIKVFAALFLVLISCKRSYLGNEVSEASSGSKEISTSTVEETEIKKEVAESMNAPQKAETKSTPNEKPKPVVQEAPVLPAGTILFLQTTKDLYASNFEAGDHFFVELEKDIIQKGKVLIPKGTTVQMEVLVSNNKKRRSSQFAVTVGGVIIDNVLRNTQTETKSIKTEDTAGGTVKRAAIGAGVGAVFDGGKGAGKGAAIGGALGLLKPGQKIHFPAGTQGAFQLEKPLTVDWL